jgi:hypothetical protein
MLRTLPRRRLFPALAALLFARPAPPTLRLGPVAIAGSALLVARPCGYLADDREGVQLDFGEMQLWIFDPADIARVNAWLASLGREPIHVDEEATR